MATRSTIAAFTPDGRIEQIYCHWDGYLDNNGVILLLHYTNPEKITELMNLGDISILGKEIGEKHDFNSSDKDDWCKAYGRDRGEVNIIKRVFENFSDFLNNRDTQGYDYLWNGFEWLVDSDESTENNEYHPFTSLRDECILAKISLE
jgi:hypothetical protein